MMTIPDVLTPAEHAKRGDLMSRKPYLARKLAAITEREKRGLISPIMRIEPSYGCNMHCEHCCNELYMDRHIIKLTGKPDPRRKITREDVREISRQADAIGIARFVISGGEPLTYKNFDEMVEDLDPERHYIVTDTNGWYLDLEKARHIKSIGVEKVQLSLDSFIEEEHDAFRKTPGSYRRVLRAIDTCKEAGLNLILSTCLVRGRAKTEEFRNLCQFAMDQGVGLYVSYAKPVGEYAGNLSCVIGKGEDADEVRRLEREFPVFTHMTPSYGSFKGCITVKGINTITQTGEITPCPYMQTSIGNVLETPLAEILARGMSNVWLGPYRDDCLIGEDPDFIQWHTEVTAGRALLPVSWEEGLKNHNELVVT